MTTEQLRDLRDAISAYLDGKTVQYRYADAWVDALSPSFDVSLRWRPKPEPVTRPWKCPADVPMHPLTVEVKS